MLIHVSALDCVYGLGNVPRIYLAMRGSLACREVEGASSRHIGRIIRRLVVTMDDGTDVPVCAGVVCSAIVEIDTPARCAHTGERKQDGPVERVQYLCTFSA